MSYRVMSKRIMERYGIRSSPRRLCDAVNEIAIMAKSSIEIKLEFGPKWEGYLTIDDKWINVKGEKIVSLVAIDSSGDAVHLELLPQATQENFDAFFRYIIERLEYPIKGLVSDLDPMLEKSKSRVFGTEIPHQKCIWHGLENVKRLISFGQLESKYKTLMTMYKGLSSSLEDRKSSYYNAKSRLEQLKSDLGLLESV